MKVLGVLVLALTASTQLLAADEPWLDQHLKANFQIPQGELTSEQFEQIRQYGETLFIARFTREEGAGRPKATQAIIPTKRKRVSEFTFSRTAGLDAAACAGCHNEPKVGGAGDFTANVFVSEGFVNADFDSLDPQFSNERNTNHLFGAGLIELLAREMTSALHALRNQALQSARSSKQPVKAELLTKGVSYGFITAQPDGVLDLSEIKGIDTDLIIRPFSQKGVFASLRQFTINAMNQHHGMEAVERFGKRWTGEEDFDEDSIKDELTAADISALVAWQASLPPPIQKPVEDTRWQQAASAGEQLFQKIQCASCHIPALPLQNLSFTDPGLWDTAGTLRQGENNQAQSTYDFGLEAWAKGLKKNDKGEFLVPLFGDLKRHVIADAQVAILGNELLSQRFVERDQFMTAELWGIASTAPYGHRGDQLTLNEIIRAHGGEGRAARDAYLGLTEDERSQVIAFLKTLVIE
jgi:cytochrome c peroxidase